jgi:hypothetical protein
VTLISNKKMLALGLALSAALAIFMAAMLASGSADSASAGPAVPATVSVAQRAAFSALRQPAASSVPAQLTTWASSPAVARYGPNPALARAVVPPDGSAAEPWYLIPGTGSVCLWVDGGTTCTSTENAATKGISLQFIPPNQKSTTSPLPPPGTPVVSTVDGIAPDGVNSVQAITKSGADEAKAPSGNGSFTIAGTDIQKVALTGGAQGAASFSVYHG